MNGVEVDLSTVEVVGDYTGAQMAAVDVEAIVDLIDHVNEGRIGVAYVARKLVIEGALPFESVLDGVLPAGMEYDALTGILSGTPTESGEFHFKINATDTVNPEVSKNYTLLIAEEGVDLPPTSLADTTASPVGSGTTTGDGAYVPGAPVTVSASAAPGFRFVNWMDNDTLVSTNASYTFNIDVNHSLVAHFTLDIPQWTITTSASPLAGGTTGGGGLLDEASQATVVATPAAGYSFTAWTENGTQVSTAASYTFTVTANRTLVANFTALPTFVVATSSSPSIGGTTTGSGNYVSGTSATVTATANAGYVFTKWTSGTTQLSSTPDYTFVVSAAKNLVANFIVAGTSKTIAVSASSDRRGTVSGGGNFVTGDSVTVTAMAKPGYAFSKWLEGNTMVSTSPSYNFMVTANRTLVASFIEAFVVTTHVSPAVGGTAEMDSATYQTNDKARATATANAGYTFANWTEDGVVVSTDRSYGFKATGNRTLVANFIADFGCTVTLNSSPNAGGSTSGDDNYNYDDDVMVSATPAEGYGFVCWTEGGVVVSTDPALAFTAMVSRALVANFAPLVTVTATADPAEGGQVTGSGDYAIGAAASLVAKENPGYAFIGWTEGSAAVDFPATYDFTVAASRTLIAHFVAIPRIDTVPSAPGGNSLVIEWPVPSTGWQLEESQDCKTWLLSVRPVGISGGKNHVTVPTTASSGFFRLAHP